MATTATYFMPQVRHVFPLILLLHGLTKNLSQWEKQDIVGTNIVHDDKAKSEFQKAAPAETFGKIDIPIPPSKPYEHLTDDEAQHFLQHGWLRVEGAIQQRYIDEWLPDLWVRTGYDEHDKSTWTEEYVHMAHHRQVRTEQFCSKAWGKIADICGGEERIHETRERWVGDNFIINFGSEARSGEDPASHPPQDKRSFHFDNDWYRSFLDSSSTGLTIVYCFTDIPKNGGGTWVCQDGITGEFSRSVLRA
jgi:hypothetical protein